MQIKVKYHFPDAGPLLQAHEGEWIDVRAAQEISIAEGHFGMINLGISVKVPDGYEAILAPRSSTYKKFGVIQTNSIGVIDSAYAGNDDVWMMPVYATRDIRIPRGERVAQFRIQPQQGVIEIEEVQDMESENRGGFGSTDVIEEALSLKK